jgi:hypothetical protein
MQKILSCVTLTKRSHLADQTGVPRHESPRINIWAHLSVSQRKAELGEAHLGLAEPRWVPVQIHFDVEFPLLFLKAVVKVSILKDGGNRPGRL